MQVILDDDGDRLGSPAAARRLDSFAGPAGSACEADDPVRAFMAAAAVFADPGRAAGLAKAPNRRYAPVADRPTQATLYPVSLFRPDFKEVKKNAGVWGDVNAHPKESDARSDLVAALGRDWRRRPLGLAKIFIEADA